MPQTPALPPAAVDAFLVDLAALYATHRLGLSSLEAIHVTALSDTEVVRDRRLFPATLDPFDAEFECHAAEYYVTVDTALVEVDQIRRATNGEPAHYFRY